MDDFFQPHPSVDHPHSDVVMTKQSFKKECDIHTILANYQKTGQLEHINQNKGVFADLPLTNDYQTALNMTLAAQAAFDALPSQVREKFANDPGQFLAALNDSNKEHDALFREFGIIEPGPLPEPVPAPTPEPKG